MKSNHDNINRDYIKRLLLYLQSLDVQPRNDILERRSLVEGGQHGDGGRCREHGYHRPISYF